MGFWGGGVLVGRRGRLRRLKRLLRRAYQHQPNENDDTYYLLTYTHYGDSPSRRCFAVIIPHSPSTSDHADILRA